MPSYLIFVRHSLPEIDPSIPASQWQLSDEGRLRCLGLAEQLTPYLPARILSSPQPKALQTAQIVAQRSKLPFSQVAGLHEHQREGAAFTSQAHFMAQVGALFAHPAERVFGEESADQAFTRFAGVVDSAIQEAGAQNLVIVTHGTVMALWAWRRLGLEPFPFWRSQTMPCILVTDPLNSKLVRFIRYHTEGDSFTSS